MLTLFIPNLNCAGCASKISKTLDKLNIPSEKYSINIIDKTLLINEDSIQLDKLKEALANKGYPARESITKDNNIVLINIDGPKCSGCVAKVQKAIKKVAPQSNVDINLVNKQASIHLNDENLKDILKAITSLGYDATIIEQNTNNETTKNNIWLNIRKISLAFIVGTSLFILMSFSKSNFAEDSSISLLWLVMLIVTSFTMYYSGSEYYKGAWQQLKHKSFSMDSLIALSTSAAWLYSALVIILPSVLPVDMKHIFLDASVFILAFMNLGHLLEDKAKAQSSDAVGKFIKLQAKTVNLLVSDKVVKMPLEFVQKNDTIRVLPGEKVPLDGIIINGSGEIDEAMLTGEPIPVTKNINDKVFAGTVNQNDTLTIKTTSDYTDNTLSKIILSVQQAQASKPKISKFVDKVTAVFVPVVICISIVTFIIWSFFDLSYAVSNAIAVLVIACPCALGLGTPMAMIIGCGKATQNGVLIKNGEALQSTSEIDYIVFDKTGTLTTGKPKVVNVVSLQEYDNKNWLHKAIYTLEMQSQHPLAKAIVEHLTNSEQLSELTFKDYIHKVGKGVSANIDGHTIKIGSRKWLNPDYQPSDSHFINIYVSIDDKLMTIFQLADKVKDDAKQTIATLHKYGIKTAILSGDDNSVVEAVAKELNIDKTFANVLPNEKALKIKELQQQGYNIGMVGDGLNDAPALSQANVGIAIGSGTDIATESADITLRDNNVYSVIKAYKYSKKIMLNIKQTLAGAFIYNILGIPIAAGLFYPVSGILLNPIFASMAMAMSSLTVIISALRLNKL